MFSFECKYPIAKGNTITKMRLRITLRIKLIVGFSLLYAVLMAGFIYLDLKGVHFLIEEEMRRTSVGFSEMLSVAAADAISSGNRVLVQGYVLKAADLPYVSSIIIQDSADVVIASTGSPSIGTVLTDALSENFRRREEMLLEEIGTPPRDLLHQSGHAFRVTVPIMVGREKVGLVRVETFSVDLNQKITDLGQRWVLFTAIAVAVGALTAALMAWAVTKELTKLVSGARRIAGGDFSQPVNIKTSDELRTLGEAFNQMAIHLQGSHSFLENQVKSRTAELRESKRELEALFNGITDLITVIDPHYNIIMTNQAVSNLVNQSSEEIVGNKCYAKCFQREKLCPNCPVKETKETLEPAFAEVRHFDEVLRLYTYPVLSSTGELKAIIEFGKIVTGEKILEEQLIQSARLASLGEMASGVAHEIRNPLAGIKSGAQFIRKRLSSDSEAGEVLSMILQETDRLEQVVASFLSFARPSASFPTKMKITEVVEKTIAITEEQLTTQNIDLIRHYDDEVPPITVDGKQMEQVFLNIFINALQAMPEGGGIELTTSQQHNRVLVKIKDSGSGIHSSIIERIFDPFFTTRAQGTGLGLSINKRIVEELGGSIKVESEVGKGTTFIVALPK